jgi:hypothetical protein
VYKYLLLKAYKYCLFSFLIRSEFPSLTAQAGRSAKGSSARDESVPVPASSRQKASGKAPVLVAQSVSRGRVDEATKRSGKIT